MNPFDEDALATEIAFMTFPPARAEIGDAFFHWREVYDLIRLNDYLNVQVRVGLPRLPTYGTKGDGLWMTITPMEIQSQWVAIQRACYHGGHIAIGGLGMGYVPLKIANELHNSDISFEIDVYESNADCIALFKHLHGERPEMAHINIIHGDLRELCVGKYYEYMYNDIYQKLLQEDIIEDIKFFLTNNDIEEYRYWGQEAALFMCAENGDLIMRARRRNIITYDDSNFFRMFSTYDGSGLRAPSYDEGFCEEAINAHIDAVEGVYDWADKNAASAS